MDPMKQNSHNTYATQRIVIQQPKRNTMYVERKNFILSKNSNRNNYREHCINQIPCTAVLGGGGGRPLPPQGAGKNECCGLVAKKR